MVHLRGPSPRRDDSGFFLLSSRFGLPPSTLQPGSRLAWPRRALAGHPWQRPRDRGSRLTVGQIPPSLRPQRGTRPVPCRVRTAAKFRAAFRVGRAPPCLRFRPPSPGCRLAWAPGGAPAPPFVTVISRSGFPAFPRPFRATREGQLGPLKDLVFSDSRLVNCADYDKRTPLHLAASGEAPLVGCLFLAPSPGRRGVRNELRGWPGLACPSLASAWNPPPGGLGLGLAMRAAVPLAAHP